jgi:hypothetical protein
MNLRGLKSNPDMRHNDELLRIGASYYSKLEPRALD